MTTNYTNTFITVSPDTKAMAGTVPAKEGTIAARQLALLLDRPYVLTSDDLLFEIHAARNGIPEADREAERRRFFGKSRACLRTSPLVKQFGWGLHHDADGRVAAYGVETEAYRELAGRTNLTVRAGVRSRR